MMYTNLTRTESRFNTCNAPTFKACYSMKLALGVINGHNW